jgi:glycosyltransferase involved in cell wall biosynthesis
MKVLFLTQYGVQAASSRTRVFQYLPFLERRGIESRVITVLPDREIGGSQILVTRNRWRKLRYYLWAVWRTLICGLRLCRQAGDFDLLFIQKVILPPPVRWLLKRRRRPLLFDFDDAIFTTEVRQRNWLAAWKQRRNTKGMPAMLRLADRAVVENEYTGDFAARHCPAVTTITGPIDTERYHPAPRNAEGNRVVLGWIGSATTLPYLDLIEEPLRRLVARFPRLQLRVIGAVAVDIQGISVEASPWALESEVRELQSFDIGLMPIPDDSWTRGKGGYKLLQYMAVGLPVVTSPVGINRQIVRHDVNGFWATTPEEWEEYLARLIENPQLRTAMGEKGRASMEAEYALAPSSQRLLESMQQTLGESSR